MSTAYYKDVYKNSDDSLITDVEIVPLSAEGLVTFTYRVFSPRSAGRENIWRESITENAPAKYSEYVPFSTGLNRDRGYYIYADTPHMKFYELGDLQTRIVHTSKINLTKLSTEAIKSNDMKRYATSYIRKKMIESKKVLADWIESENAKAQLIFDEHKKGEHTRAWFETNNLSLYQKFSNFIKKLVQKKETNNV